MIYRRFVRKEALAAWELLSDQRLDEIRIADNVHFVYLGDHPLAADIHGANAVRAWLRNELFGRLPGLRFEVEDMIVEGNLRTTRIATRYSAKRDGQLVYRGVQFTRIRWGRMVEECVLPDTAALAAALASARADG
jgi:ketosteroid isomerase-like protein